ncbi:hypothetical protein PIB30_024510 [Stylosanthes scabra]|uniref:Uncharacterized protein n=1 Tax=Stylosanthes scabra TaxID=79078 RepID=A0ABU6Z6J0_9FABA|nr:hypothetical protein [Stylosanthes scabra]
MSDDCDSVRNGREHRCCRFFFFRHLCCCRHSFTAFGWETSAASRRVSPQGIRGVCPREESVTIVTLFEVKESIIATASSFPVCVGMMVVRRKKELVSSEPENFVAAAGNPSSASLLRPKAQWLTVARPSRLATESWKFHPQLWLWARSDRVKCGIYGANFPGWTISREVQLLYQFNNPSNSRNLA